MKQMSTIKFPNQVEAYEIVDAVARLEAAGKSDIGHTHTRSEITDFAHEHDERYYTEVEIDAKVIELKEYTDSQIGNIPSVDAYTKDQTDTLLNDVRDYTDAAVEPLETKEDAQSKYDIITEAKADWNQNDEGAIDHIKNRTHYAILTDTASITPTYNVTVTSTSSDAQWSYVSLGAESADLVEGLISINGPLYPYLSTVGHWSMATDEHKIIIDSAVYFLLRTNGFLHLYSNSADNLLNKSISVWPKYSEYHQLSEAYIPDSIARRATVVTSINGQYGDITTSQADWNELDSNVDSYIQNKPFGVTSVSIGSSQLSITSSAIGYSGGSYYYIELFSDIELSNLSLAKDGYISIGHGEDYEEWFYTNDQPFYNDVFVSFYQLHDNHYRIRLQALDTTFLSKFTYKDIQIWTAIKTIQPLSIEYGGTGATTAVEALANLGITYGTEDLIDGESELATGTLYFVYEKQ